jgi:trigger factor
MAVNVETLEKLERRITLTIPADAITIKSKSSRLKKLSRTVKADGFRPGKVPMSVVAQRYGYSVQYEVMNDKIGQAFAMPPPTRPSCGWPACRASRRRTSAPEGQLAFDATFEVYPEVKLGDLSGTEVERVNARSPRKPSTARSTSCASSAAPSPSARPPKALPRPTA